MKSLPLAVLVVGLLVLFLAARFASALDFLAVASLTGVPILFAAVTLLVRPILRAWRPGLRSAAGLAVVGLIAAAAVAQDLNGGSTASKSSARQIAQVAALPYVDWAPAEGESGVVRYDRDQAWPALTLFQSRSVSEAHLIDLDGRPVHRWAADTEPWLFAEPTIGGGLVVITEGGNLVRLDAESQIRWVRSVAAHHDLEVDSDGTLRVLTHAVRVVFRFGLPVPIIDDQIVTLSPDGEPLSQWSLWDTLDLRLDGRTVASIFAWMLDPMNAWGARSGKFLGPADVLHSNSVEILDRDVAGLGRRGNLLVCVRELDRIGVVEPDTGRWTWSWGPGELSRPHHPSVLPNGHVLVFDNGRKEERSRVLEVDPEAGQIVWSYEAPGFYSPRQGSAQRLPNGNTLVTESDDGRAFEVTRDGEIVWELVNPVRDERREKRAVIYRMMRVTDPERLPPSLQSAAAALTAGPGSG